MIIGFDLQALQTENSRNRGIGRYTQNLVNEILKQNSKNTHKLFFNNNYKERQNLEINNNCKTINIDYIISKQSEDITNNLIQFLKYFYTELDILHIHSPFEGYPSNLPVINPYLSKINSLVCATVYDLIPINFSEHYFSNPEFKNAYFRNLKTLYDSDFLFAISESTRRDLINFLGIHPENIINIEGASTGNFYKLNEEKKKTCNKLKTKFSIKEKFVLYTGGIDFRKNIEKSIKAFSQIDKSLLEKTSYVIVCKILEPDRKRLTKLAEEYRIKENLILTGYLSDEELNLLYNCCNLYLFPSLMEGFGLPVIEAMTCGAPVIGSNTSSIPELIEDKQFMFNPTDEKEIANLITKLLTDKQLRQKSIHHSLTKCQNYSWNKVAEKVIAAYQKRENKIRRKKSKILIKKPRIAFFSPLPPRKSGIADYNASMIPFLSKFWEIDFFIDNYSCTEPYLTSNYKIFSYEDFEVQNQIKNYDTIIYHFGNSDNHIYMFDMLNKHPGIVILHDVYLSGVIYWMTARIGKLEEFVKEVIYSHGEKGQKLVEKAKKNLIPWDKLIWDLQINKRVLDNSSHVIVHSNWDKNNILQLYPELDKKISVVPHFCRLSFFENKEIYKTKLGFSSDQFLICTFGFVVPTKKIETILKQIKSELSKKPNWKYVIVGDIEDRYAQIIKKMVDSYKISKNVVFTGFIDDKIYSDFLKACDIAIQLRKDIRGGGSGTISRALGAGIPTIISDMGPFSEFPDEVVIKLKPKNEAELGTILNDYYENSKKRENLGKKAKDFAISNLSCTTCAEMYANEIHEIISKETLEK